MLHVEMSRITAKPPRLGDAISYLASEVRPAVEGQPGNLGTSLFIAPDAGAMGFESFWASDGALVASEDVIAASVREAARRAGERSPASAARSWCSSGRHRCAAGRGCG